MESPLRECDDNEALLTGMGARERARLDVMVEAFIRDVLPPHGAGRIAYAAHSFEERAAELADPKRTVVLQFAAALRQRLAQPRPH